MLTIIEEVNVTPKSISKIDAKKLKETIRKIVNRGSLVLTGHVEQKMGERIKNDLSRM